MKTAVLSLFKTNHELINFMRTGSRLNNLQARRSALKIAVIDDQAFQPQTNLQSFGYRVDQIGDIKSVSEIARYDIILCDIMGVGKHFNSKAQGATIISEIKNAHPEKIVIAYTGGSTGEPAVQFARERADDLIKKDVDTEEWIAKLDELGAKAVDPYIIWNKVRSRLISLDADTRDILILEDGYVRSVLERDANLSSLTSRLATRRISPDVRAIIQGLASSAIFAAIVRHS